MSAKTRASSVPQGYQQQADAAISQANPVSTTLYTVLDTTKNVRVISISASITWATTQPTPIEIVLTIDGETITFAKTNPVNATEYLAYIDGTKAPASQLMAGISGDFFSRPFLTEGRSVKIEVRITWVTTQPNPLTGRVKYAKIP